MRRREQDYRATWGISFYFTDPSQPIFREARSQRKKLKDGGSTVGPLIRKYTETWFWGGFSGTKDISGWKRQINL